MSLSHNCVGFIIFGDAVMTQIMVDMQEYSVIE